MKGDSFCYAAGEAMSLLVRNALRIMAVDVIGSWVSWLGKLTVSLGAGLIALVYLSSSKYSDATQNTFVESGLLVVILSVFIAYCISDLFFSIYDVRAHFPPIRSCSISVSARPSAASHHPSPAAFLAFLPRLV